MVVAILGILASTAVPMYSGHIAWGGRLQAPAQLLRLHEYAGRHHIEKRIYPPADFSRFSPVPSTGVTWCLSEAGQDNVLFSFQLNLVGPMRGDCCGSFRIDNDGRTSVVGYNTSIWPNSAAGQAAALAYSWGGV